MALRDMDDKGNIRDVRKLDYEDEFNKRWLRISQERRDAIETEINRRLHELLESPNPKWGSIMNTSIEGGKANPHTGLRGDWSGTVFDPIYQVCGESEEQAALMYGTVWKKVIIERAEPWVGLRADPTFPKQGITLQGKSYFPDTKRKK